MTTTYTVDGIVQLLHALLGPSWEERRAADMQLLRFRSFVPEGGNPALTRLIDDGTERLGILTETFFRDLTAFWMSACAEARAENAIRFGATASGSTWPIDYSAETFPLHEPRHLWPSCVYGAGTKNIAWEEV